MEATVVKKNPWKKAFFIAVACGILGIILTLFGTAVEVSSVMESQVKNVSSAVVNEFDKNGMISVTPRLVLTQFSISRKTVAMNLMDSDDHFNSPDKVQVDFVESESGRVISSETIYLKTNDAGAKVLVVDFPQSAVKTDIKIRKL